MRKYLVKCIEGIHRGLHILEFKWDAGTWGAISVDARYAQSFSELEATRAADRLNETARANGSKDRWVSMEKT